VQLVRTEDQELLAKTAADFVAGRSPVARVRALRDADDPLGFSPALWKEMAELGWVGIPFPEELGGAGLGLAELAVVLEELGRTLAPEPFLATVLLAGQAILRGGSESQQRAWIPRVCAGEAFLALAGPERASPVDPLRIATRAERGPGGSWRLSGEKVHVLDGPAAHAFVVSARSRGAEADRDGISLFLVPAGTAGLEVERQRRVDSRGAAIVRLRGALVGAEARIGPEGGAADLLEAVADLATAGLSAEMLGSASEAFARTLHYLKHRVQFGVPIGSFQALKHRAAQCFIELELLRSAVAAAARALDAGAPDARSLVSLAKARASETAMLVANEAVQMHGGIGMTDEHEIGFYLKRARVGEQTFGDAAYHRDRWARLSGY
jgi:alkylation response protein AidB-like acyl-CoA dehydrogenase